MATHLTPQTSEKNPVPHRFANPFSEFRHEMDGLFDRFFSARPAFNFRLPVRESFSTLTTSKAEMMIPEIDIHESKKNIKLRAELPGLEKDDIDLILQEGILTLRGEKKFEQESEEDNIPVVECRYGKFERTFTLPSSVDQSKLKAKFRNGVLTIVVPKLAEKEWPEKHIQIT
ncbi:MAG: Hsp20/alpha crystallin family protein [Sphingomonadales bacterium]